MKKSIKTSDITVTALFAAIVCVATFIIKIPVPATQGYIHFGDAFVILAGIFPGMGLGMLSAGIGSGLADLFSGYPVYSPVSFGIKAVCAIVVSLIYKKTKNRIHSPMVRLIISGIVSTAIITGGYLIFELALYGTAAFLEIPMNLIQGGAATGISCALYPLFSRIPNLKGRF